MSDEVHLTIVGLIGAFVFAGWLYFEIVWGMFS